MTKEEFKFILDRQQSSGLSVRDFCENEAYTLSSFNYWKSKFGFVRNHQKACVSDFHPIEIKNTTQDLPTRVKEDGFNIEVVFPSGLKIRLKDIRDLESASSIINKTMAAYVLSE